MKFWSQWIQSNGDRLIDYHLVHPSKQESPNRRGTGCF